jgi:hypothetical protein
MRRVALPSPIQDAAMRTVAGQPALAASDARWIPGDALRLDGGAKL